MITQNKLTTKYSKNEATTLFIVIMPLRPPFVHTILYLCFILNAPVSMKTFYLSIILFCATLSMAASAQTTTDQLVGNYINNNEWFKLR